MRVAETVRIDLAERLRIAVRGEHIRHRNRVVPEALDAMRDRRTPWIDAEDGGHDRVETLCLRWIARIRPAAVAEAMIAAAGVEQPVIRIAEPRRRVELHRT